MWDVYRVSRKGVCSYSAVNSAMLKIRITNYNMHCTAFLVAVHWVSRGRRSSTRRLTRQMSPHICSYLGFNISYSSFHISQMSFYISYAGFHNLSWALILMIMIYEEDDDDCDCKIKYDWMVGGWGGFYLNCLNSRSGAFLLSRELYLGRHE